MDKEARLKELVKSFFEDYLDYTEVSDMGNEFHPIYISSCRVLMTQELSEILKEMRELSGVKHNDIKQDWSFIDKWFDDYGHTLEPRELARWAYNNGLWQQAIKTIDE